MSKKLVPLGDRVLIQRDEPEKVSKGGIIIPDNSQRKTFVGTVLEKGIETDDQIQVGDKVFVSLYVGQEFTFNEIGCTMVHQADVLARVEECAD